MTERVFKDWGDRSELDPNLAWDIFELKLHHDYLALKKATLYPRDLTSLVTTSREIIFLQKKMEAARAARLAGEDILIWKLSYQKPQY
jgi:hypothetical protein